MPSRRTELVLSFTRILGFATALSGATLLSLAVVVAPAAPAQEQVDIDAHAQTTPFPHFWEEMFGSGRAILTLRESYREDLRAVKQMTDFRLCALSRHPARRSRRIQRGRARQSRLQLRLCRSDLRWPAQERCAPRRRDQLHAQEARLQSGRASSLLVQAERLAAQEHGEVGRSYDRTSRSTSSIATASTRSSQWYFEVWNEPNIDFWNGIPRQKTYFELYDHTARDLKKCKSAPARRRPGHCGGRLGARVSQTHRREQRSSRFRLHPRLRGRHRRRPLRHQRRYPHGRPRLPRFAKVRSRSSASAMPDLPLFWTEWNVPGHEGVARHHLRRPCARQHRPRVRRPGRHDVLLDLLRCL